MVKMKIEIKKELIWRYRFIYENIEYIVGPFLLYGNNYENEFIINKKIPYELLKLGQDFLLGDEKAEFSKFVMYVERRKRNPEFVKSIPADIDKERLMWEFLNSIGNLIINQDGNKILREKKLQAMNEYYKILNYQNKMEGQKLGSKLIANYLNSKRNKWKIPFGKDKDEANFKTTKFVKALNDKSNYDETSLGILSDKEKQEIYLLFHDELPWDLLVKCEVDKNSIYKPREKRLINRNCQSPCGEEFYLIEENIFINPNDEFYDYYQICPNCGYIITVPHSLLPNTIRTRIEERCLNAKYSFSSQILKAELKSMDYRDDKLIKIRTKKY